MHRARGPPSGSRDATEPGTREEDGMAGSLTIRFMALLFGRVCHVTVTIRPR